ncbi:MAG: C39 family peptidase [Eubacteriales bacterium]|nr:C39 family peptidase [Eubacteriales bacterium]
MIKEKKSTLKKKKRKKPYNGAIMALLSSIIALSVILIVYIDSKLPKKDTTASVEVTNVLETSPVDSSLLLSSNNTYTTAAAPDESTFPSVYSMDIPHINQFPELPTGCEITSLAQVLTYLGYNVDKVELAKNYLPMSNVVTPGCFINYFLGEPWSNHGSGCFAPAIATAANKFFSDNGSTLSAYVISYSSVDALFKELSMGHPVIVWTSYNYNSPEVTYKEVDLGNGNSFSWPTNEHCVVLSGYNLETKTVTLADPTYGIVEKTIDEFTYFYQKYFYQAVTIR